jgi:hypothetical protein
MLCHENVCTAQEQPLLTSSQQVQRLMQHVMCPAPADALAVNLPGLLLCTLLAALLLGPPA